MEKNMFKAAFLFVFIFMTFHVFAPDARAYTLSYKQTMKFQKNQEMVMRMWLKDGKMRIESGEGPYKMTSLHLDDGIYNMIPGQNVITKIAVPKTGLNYLSDHEAYVNEIKGFGAVLKGTEKIDGKACDVYEYTEPATGNTVTSWVSQEIKFPLKMIAKGPAGEMEMTYSEIRIDQPIPDEMFDLPEGAQVIDMSTKTP
jgi:outer membrane lipoprotein-sorting protein